MLMTIITARIKQRGSDKEFFHFIVHDQSASVYLEGNVYFRIA